MSPSPVAAQRDLVDGLPYRPLEPKYRKLLEDGILPTRSRAKEAVPKAYAGLILHMIWCGWRLTEIMVALLDAGNEASDPFLAMERFAARRKIQSIYNTKRKLVLAELLRRDPAGLTEELVNWRNQVVPTLVGRSAAKDRAVLTELVERAITLRTWKPAISDRTLGDLVGLDRQAANRSLRRLQRVGVLARQPQTERGKVIELSRERASILHGATPYKVLVRLRETSVIVRSHPLWSDQGLGHSAGIVWTALDESHDVPELVDLTGLSKTTVYTASSLLEHHQLVERQGTQRARTRHTLDAVDEILGARFRLKRRAQQNEREQGEWWSWSTGQQQQSLLERQRAMDWNRAQAAAQRERIETQVRHLEGVRPATRRSRASSALHDPARPPRAREVETLGGIDETMSNDRLGQPATSDVRRVSG